MFASKAGKGGAALIMNHEDVQETIEKELFDQNKFTKLEDNADDQLIKVKDQVKFLLIDLKRKESL